MRCDRIDDTEQAHIAGLRPVELMIDKDPHRRQANRASIHTILWLKWDPIGVRAMGGPEREYDRYIDGISALLMDPSRTQDDIAAHLLDIHSRQIGLRVTPAAIERCNRVARSLIDACR